MEQETHMTQLSQSLFFLSEITYCIISWLDDFISEYRKARYKAQTINELRLLSDKELRDIGITRGEIYDVAHRTSYDDK